LDAKTLEPCNSVLKSETLHEKTYSYTSSLICVVVFVDAFDFTCIPKKACSIDMRNEEITIKISASLID